ncbi:MAG: hypothetical protein ABI409_03240 [Ramlibacter sp.]
MLVTSVDVDPGHLRRHRRRAHGPRQRSVRDLLWQLPGTYEPPFCHAQARALFNTLR